MIMLSEIYFVTIFIVSIEILNSSNDWLWFLDLDNIEFFWNLLISLDKRFTVLYQSIHIPP